MYKLILLVLLSVSTLNAVRAQDPQYSQFYSNPLYLNPGFAGATLEGRANLNSRIQWAGVNRPYFTTTAAVDRNFEKYKSGVGLIATYDKTGTANVKSVDIGLQYSYRIDLSGKWSIRPGLQFSYVNRSIDFYKLTFPDQIVADQGLAATGESISPTSRISYFDFSSGVLAHNDKAWIGLATHHLNTPNQSLVNSGDTKSVLPVKINLHGGYKIDLTNKILAKSYGAMRESSITPAFNYRRQGKFDQLDIGCYLHYEPVVLGLWYRGIPVKQYKAGYGNNESVAVLVGFKQKNFSVGYSYDLTLSRLALYNTAGSHEISLSFSFTTTNPAKKPKLRKRDMVIPCPKF